MSRKSREQIQAEIKKLQSELLEIHTMRPGSLSQQYSACQRTGCKCVDPVRPQKHGPFYKLRYTQRGKSTSQFVRPQFVEEVRRQIAAYKKFKNLTRKWVALAVELSKLELEEARSVTPTMRWPEAS
jgi:ribosomal protein L29